MLVLSSEEEPTEWETLKVLAKLVPRICHNINRVCYVFGGLVNYPILDVTPTHLTPNVLATLREADSIAQNILQNSGCFSKVAQMPIIIIPIHFDRDVVTRQPSCQRSIVIRTFITDDFMTGIPAIPNKHLPLEVSGGSLWFNSLINAYSLCLFVCFIYCVVKTEKVIKRMVQEIQAVPGISRVLYDLTAKPPGTTEWE